jgi:hypothetical protein
MAAPVMPTVISSIRVDEQDAPQRPITIDRAATHPSITRGESAQYAAGALPPVVNIWPGR